MGETLTFTVGIYKKLWNLFTAADRSRLVQADLEILAATTHIVGSRAREFEISDFQANEVNDAWPETKDPRKD